MNGERRMHAVDNPKLAVLIDADNASASIVKELLEEVAKFGTATIKRAYGDWTTQNLVGWKEHLNRHAIQPMQQFAYTKGKNATDSSLIIDAMDLLYADHVDGFCIVSSDSDFTRLANRLRESRKLVYGFGERKTPEPFRAACDQFVFFEVLKRTPVKPAATPDPAPARKRRPAGKRGAVAEAAPEPPIEPQEDVAVDVPGLPDLRDALTRALEATSRDSGWARLAAVGSQMARNNPSFDSRLYGSPKLRDLVRKQPYLEVKEFDDGSGTSHLNVRLR